MTTVDAEGCLCTALRQAARRISQHYDKALLPTGVSTNQFSILRRLERLGPVTIQALADHLVMDRSTLGHLLRPLERRGLLALASPRSDRRRREITLSPAGAALIAEALPLWHAAQQSFEAAYGADRAVGLRGDLRRICLTEPADANQD